MNLTADCLWSVLMAEQSPVSHSWPDGIDVLILVGLGVVVAAVLIFGFGLWYADFRNWLKACGRKLILMRDYLPQIPRWARHKTPRSLRVFGLRLPCSEDDLLHSYRQLVKGNHPDHGGNLEAFMQLQMDFEEARKFLQSLHEPIHESANG